MPAERLSMRKVREVLRLKYACGASDRVIARSGSISGGRRWSGSPGRSRSNSTIRRWSASCSRRLATTRRVDFAGDTVPVFDALTGEAGAAKIFVAVLGASNYTYAEARFSEAPTRFPKRVGSPYSGFSGSVISGQVRRVTTAH
jgi:hypothetical protein